MTNVLISSDLLDYADGTVMEPTDTITREGEADEKVIPVDPKEAKQFKVKNARTVVALTTTMEHQEAVKFSDYRLASEIWAQLQRIHEHRTKENKVLVMQNFHNLKMEPSESVADFFMRVQSGARALEELKEKQSETTMMAIILNGLTPKFDSFVPAWDSVEPEKQTVRALQERLVKEENRLGVRDQERTALMSTTSVPGRHKQRKGPPAHSGHSKRSLKKDTSKVQC